MVQHMVHTTIDKIRDDLGGFYWNFWESQPVNLHFSILVSHAFDMRPMIKYVQVDVNKFVPGTDSAHAAYYCHINYP